MSFTKIYNNMERKKLDVILRNLLVAGNIVTVPFEQMREIRKELDRFVKPVDCPLVDDRPSVLKSNGRKKQEEAHA